MVCFDVLVIIRFSKHDRYSCEVIKLNRLSNYSVVMLAIYMAVLMAKDKSGYNDMNIILYETDASK